MMKDSHYYKELLRRYLSNDCSPSEAEELLSFLEKDESNRLLLEQIKSQFHAAPGSQSVSKDYESRVRVKLQKAIKPAPVVKMNRSWFKLAAAAAVFGLLCLTAIFLFRGPQNVSQVAQKPERTDRFQNDIQPGGEKAMLVLANGESIVLDSAGNGMLTEQGSTRVIKLDNGQLSYAAGTGANAASDILYNTIITPRGGQYQVILPDETKVWLNASSTLRFPTAFIGKQRKVDITGEAYFEVQKNAAMPFIVSINGTSEVEVLGTHFNIMAYGDEQEMRTTLLEGAVNFRNGPITKSLKPGQQALLDKEGVKVRNDVDLEKAVAWKNGLFDFNDDAIADIMRQLSRWYDIDVTYAGKIPVGHYVGSIRRKSNIAEVLKMVELAGDVRFEIQGKKVIVKSSAK